MKVAHLILAHNAPQQLERLIKRLAHPDAHIYIHLDKKTGIAPFNYLKDLENVSFIKHRVKIYWGSYNMVQATLNGFKEIAAAGNYQFINLLSGQDYPLKSPAIIHDFLSKNAETAFMNYLLFDPEWMEAWSRVRLYHFNNWRMPGRYILQELVNKLFTGRKIPDNMMMVGRSQWFTIPMECVNFILRYWQSNARLRRFIKLTWGPDEFIFQTVLYNSIHQSKMVNNDLRYIDWSGGGVSPKLLTLEDATDLIGSGRFYARKFDINKDSAVLDLIDQHSND